MKDEGRHPNAITLHSPLSTLHFGFHSASFRGVLIGVLCAIFCWLLGGTPLLRGLDRRESDGCFAHRGPRSSAAKVIVVALDEASLEAIDKPLLFFSPELAKVVSYMHRQGAAAIGLDILVPSRETTIEYLLPGGAGDAGALGEAVGRAGNVVLPEWLALGQGPLFEWAVPSARPWADLGFADFTVDADSRIRRQELRRFTEDGVHACLALALLAKARGMSQEQLSAEELSLDGRVVPLDSEGCLTINYVGPPGSIRRVSFRDVLAAANASSEQKQSPAWAADFRDAIVLIGSTVGSFQDCFLTPYTEQTFWQSMRSDAGPWELQMPGVEIHANTLATLLDQAYITTPWFLSSPLVLLFVGGLMGAVLARCSLELGAIVALTHHLAWRGLAVGAFCWAGWRVEIAPMLLLGVLLYGTIFAIRWRWIRRMMGMVKSETVARALEAGGAKLDLRGQQREITVLFCDIRDFTPFAERHAPQEVVRLLNAFFAAAVPAIEAEGGTVNQYIGDAILALFGAPQAQPDHARRAVRAAAEVVRRVHALTDRWKELGAAQFRVGVGIHTGPAVVGTVGSPRRLDYTAIGDTVNTAARIESANKELQTEVLISESTFRALPDEERQQIAALGPPKTLTLKGKQAPLPVYSTTLNT